MQHFLEPSRVQRARRGAQPVTPDPVTSDHQPPSGVSAGVLHALGLSRLEHSLYTALVSHSPLSRAEIDDLVVEHDDECLGDRTHATTLDRLVALELVTELPTDPLRYAAVPPRVALDALLSIRTRRLGRAHRHMLQLATGLGHHTDDTTEPAPVDVVRGRSLAGQALAGHVRDVHHELLVFDKPPYLSDGNLARRDDSLAGVSYRVIYDRRAVELPGRVVEVSSVERTSGHEIRVADLPVKLVLVDGQVAAMPIDHVTHPIEALVMVNDPALLAALRALFEVCWEHAVPVGISNDLAGSPDDLPDAERKLLSLLASGFTDRAIAARLGWGERTVSNRVRELMDQLGAETRFQAGYQAVTRGWLGGRAGDSSRAACSSGPA